MAVGVAIALGGLRVTKSLLYGLEAHDPTTIVLAVLLLAGVSLLASGCRLSAPHGSTRFQALREE